MEIISISSQNRNFTSLSWPDASKSASREGSTLVWPFGACEQHGPHLPLITDTFFAENILAEIVDRLPPDFPLWTLPPQNIGFSPEHLGFPGTLSLSAELMLKTITEVGRQLADMGFQRLVFFNAHGGQIGLLQAIAREIRVQCPSMAVLPCFLWSGVDSLKDLIPDKEVEQGLHAALAETSLMLALKPDLVGTLRPFDGEGNDGEDKTNSIPKGWSLEGAAPYAWLTKDLSETGVVGDSREASYELGVKIKEALVEHWYELFVNLMESKWPCLESQKY